MVRRTRRQETSETGLEPGALPAFQIGGALRPLSSLELAAIEAHAYDILSTVGMVGLPAEATERAIAAGAWRRPD